MYAHGGDGAKAGRKICWVLLGREITSASGIPRRGKQLGVRTAFVVSTHALQLNQKGLFLCPYGLFPTSKCSGIGNVPFFCFTGNMFCCYDLPPPSIEYLNTSGMLQNLFSVCLSGSPPISENKKDLKQAN